MAAANAEYRCFIGGLSSATTDQTLADSFSKYGDLIDSKIIHDRETGDSRGFGFVTFNDERSMREAIREMDGQDLDGRSITVMEDKDHNSQDSSGTDDKKRKKRKNEQKEEKKNRTKRRKVKEINKHC